MKKKLLSLVLAGAMVASTSVSAFAEDRPYEIQPNSPTNAEVEITGDIESSNGQVLPGTVEVTVPTNASFTVKKDGTIESGTMTIRNKGKATVSVIASKFIDTTGEKDINLVKENQLDQANRSKVSLKLTGGEKNIILTSQANGEGKTAGKMYDATNDHEITENDDFVIKKVEANGTLNLQLKGQGTAYLDASSGGVTNSGDAVNDTFKLILKIKQERNS